MNKIGLTFVFEEENTDGNMEKYLVPNLTVDDYLINEDFALDLRELANSCRFDGEHFILTCGCGEPGCAGIFDGFYVTQHDDTVSWRIGSPVRREYQKQRPPNYSDPEYVFDRKQYFEAIAGGIEDAKNQLRYAEQRGELVKCGPYGFTTYDLAMLEIRPSGFCSPRVNKALEYSAKAHIAQKRKGTDIPYISHPYAIGMILSNAGCSEDVIIAGILHDTVEDTEVTLEDITANFGDKVAAIVAGCSEPDKDLSWEERKQHTLDELKNASLEIHYVACADKLHNISTMIEEHKSIGDAVWQRFKRGKEQQSWYFHGLLNSLSEGGLYGTPLYREFKRAIETIFGRHEYDNS